MDREDAQIYFYRIGVEYYVVGRFSYFCHYLLMTGVLFHHAIEMFLKGKLLDNFSAQQLKDQFGHNLHRLWNEFKRECKDPSLRQYEGTIQRLNRWEDLRYPPKKGGSSGGISMSLDMRKGDKSGVTYPKMKEESKYKVNLEEMDELVKKLFSVIQLNPKFFGEFTTGEAKAFYQKENRHLM
jgi:hypothetical protein